MKTTLEAKVEARNLVAAEHNRLLPLLAAAFAPLVGQKILKADGSLMEKVIVKVMAPVVPSAGIQIYKLSSNYSLAFVVKACVLCDKGGCVYDEATVYVGELDGSTLKALIAPQPLPTGYTVAGVLEARKNLEAAKAAFSKAESAVWPFGSYDR
jgi:hypothetical protein